MDFIEKLMKSSDRNFKGSPIPGLKFFLEVIKGKSELILLVLFIQLLN